jgi:hypothetical protein
VGAAIVREGHEGLGASRADASGRRGAARGRPRRFDTLVDKLRLDLGPRVSSEIGDGTRGKRARARTVRPGRRGMSERARRRHRRWMRRSAVTAATRGVSLSDRAPRGRAFR